MFGARIRSAAELGQGMKQLCQSGDSNIWFVDGDAKSLPLNCQVYFKDGCIMKKAISLPEKKQLGRYIGRYFTNTGVLRCVGDGYRFDVYSLFKTFMDSYRTMLYEQYVAYIHVFSYIGEHTFMDIFKTNNVDLVVHNFKRAGVQLNIDDEWFLGCAVDRFKLNHFVNNVLDRLEPRLYLDINGKQTLKHPHTTRQ